MIICYIGNFRPEFSTENDVKKSLEALGHTVIPCQEDTHNVSAIVKAAEPAHLVLYTKTWGIKGDEHRLMKLLSRKGIPTVSLHLDLYWGLKRENTIGKGFFWLADYVFSADGGHQKEFAEAGVNHFWMQPAVLKDSCYVAEPDYERFPHDIVFVGSWSKYHEEYPHRKRLVEFLMAVYGDRFKVHGANGDTVRGHDLNVLYSSAKIVIGDSIEGENYWSDRVPETLGRGGFLMFPQTKGLDTVVKDGVHYVSYSRYDLPSLRKDIDNWLTRDADRARIKKAAHEHIREHNTYENLCRTMLDIVIEEENKKNEHPHE